MDNPEDKENMASTQNDGTVRHMLVDFASSTTAHGVNRFATANAFQTRMSWFVIWLGVMIGFLYMIIQLVLLYSSHPVSTSISLSYEESITFPGITVCNLNMILRTPYKTFLKENNTTTSGTSDTENTNKNQFTAVQTLPPGFDSSKLIVDDIQSKTMDLLSDINELSLEEKMQMGYQFEKFITYCNWGELACDKGPLYESYWTQTWNWKYGNCFTFNGFTSKNGSTLPSLTSVSSGSSQGLLLNIDINGNDYVPSLTQERGIRLLIEDQDMVLFPYEKGFSIAPGLVASISLRKHLIEREDSYGNGSCRDISRENNKYSLQGCMAMCKAITHARICNCTTLQYSALSLQIKCNTSKGESCVMAVNSDFQNGKRDCTNQCPPPCSDTIFDLKMTHGRIYPEGYKERFKVKNMTDDYVNNNILQLNIFYDDQTVQTIATSQYYKFDNLISDVGGQLGLWIGVSAVTCVEFIALIWNIILYIFNRKKGKKVHDTNE